jgi:hypothetical protein
LKKLHEYRGGRFKSVVIEARSLTLQAHKHDKRLQRTDRQTSHEKKNELALYEKAKRHKSHHEYVPRGSSKTAEKQQ